MCAPGVSASIRPGPTRPVRPARIGPERGSAVIEFVFVSVLLVFLLFAVLQLAVYFYLRNLVAAATAQAARYAASSGVDPGSGGPRAVALIEQGFAAHLGLDVRCSSVTGTDTGSGLRTVSVTCRGHLRAMLVPLGPAVALTARSSVLREPAP